MAYPASYFTGPLGANNLLPAVQTTGAFLILWYDDQSGLTAAQKRTNVQQRMTDCGRSFDGIGILWAGVFTPNSTNTSGLGVQAEQWIHDQGSFPVVTWCPNRATKGTTNLNTMQEINNGLHDTKFVNAGNYWKTLPFKVMWRMAHEFDGTWFPWSPTANATANDGFPNPGCTSAEWISAYRRAVYLVTGHGTNPGGPATAGATNVGTCWCPTNTFNGPLATSCYPGDVYVDWVGSDGYNQAGGAQTSPLHAGWAEWWEIFNFTGHGSAAVCKHDEFGPAKPYFVMETGSLYDSGDVNRKANWYRNIATHVNAKPDMPYLCGIQFFDQNLAPTEGFDWRVDRNQTFAMVAPNTPGSVDAVTYQGFKDFAANANWNVGLLAAGGSSYTPTIWVNNTTPAINATNLNKLKDELASQALVQGISHTLQTWVNGAAPAVSDPTNLNEMERVADLVAASVSPPLSYTPTTWASGWTPARNATNLNHLENQAQANRAAISAGGSGEPTPTFYYDFDFVKIADPPYTSVQWDNDPGADGPGAGIQATPDGYSVSLVNAPVGGGRALRFEIRDADGGWPQDTTGMRSQVRMSTSATWNKNPMVVGDIRWFLFEMYLPNNSPAGEYFDWGRGNWNTWMGLHPDTGNTSGRDWGCFDIGTDGPYNTHPFYMTFKIAGGGGVNPYDQLEYPRLFQLTNADGTRYAPNFNRRIRILLGGKFSPIHANGWYEGWVDGVNVLPRTPHATMWTGDTQTYFKCGPYKSATNAFPTNGKTVMYWTRIAIGT